MFEFLSNSSFDRSCFHKVHMMTEANKPPELNKPAVFLFMLDFRVQDSRSPWELSTRPVLPSLLEQ